MPKIKGISAFAKKQGFMVGDHVLSIGGFPMLDELDYLYFDNENDFEVELERNGLHHKIRVNKREGQTLGLEFDAEMKPIHCKNHCIFCFVDQLPKGLRDSLYIKDDDYRYSFISGSYVTLTNVSEKELNRIIRLKLSPLYISVHAFDDEVRKFMVKNPNTSKLKGYMQRLGNAGIKMHTQLVIVPGINDAEIMCESIRGLHSMKGVLTVAIVPVGMTSHRENLAKLNCVSEENARQTIQLVEELNNQFSGFCWCSDEYYVKANKPICDYKYYGDFEQIENGVGLLSDFTDNLDFSLSEAKNANLNKKIALVTGSSFAKILTEQIRPVEKKLGIECRVYGIINTFFGESVTVAGLVTAGDIISQMKDVKCDAIVIPDNMLREFTDVFLDNMSLCDVEEALQKPIIVVAHNGSDLVEKIATYF